LGPDDITKRLTEPLIRPAPTSLLFFFHVLPPLTVITPVLANSTDLPPINTNGNQFAQRFPDGGDYWGFTWQTGGWLSMWIDPSTGGGPGELLASSVH
jgi:hypothetical protein